jgi:hypothetical protein
MRLGVIVYLADTEVAGFNELKAVLKAYHADTWQS